MASRDEIVVGVDGSPASEIAIDHAVAMGRRRGVGVVLVLVEGPPDLPPGITWSVPTTTYAEVRHEMARNAERRKLVVLAERASRQGAAVSYRILEGHPDHELSRIATELGADVIVVGGGPGGEPRTGLGSVADRTIRLADCSVLIARGSAPDAGYQRIVAGIDFSALGDDALERAVAMATPGCRIEVVHCFAAWSESPIDPHQQAARAEVRAVLIAAGEARVARMRERVPGLDIGFHLIDRGGTHGVVDFAIDHGADLIVVGSHGRRGTHRFILGSVADATMRHATCSVLIARPKR
jgi:nucleotide-binding universal stress UspA family protein